VDAKSTKAFVSAEVTFALDKALLGYVMVVLNVRLG